MTKSPYNGICCGEIPSTRKVLSPTPRGLVSLAPNYPVALLTNHDSSVPVGSSRKRVGFVRQTSRVCPEKESQMWVGPLAPRGFVCSVLFMPLRASSSPCVPTRIAQPVPPPSPLPCDFPGVELRGEADES